MQCKCSISIFESSWDLNANEIRMNRWIANWTVMDAYMLLKYIATHAQAGMNPARPGVAHALSLDIVNWGGSQVKITI
ncbi:hypothetical protein H1R20_g11479, partial [Candolleomyces eurysporus]